MAMFHDVRFPENIKYSSIGGPQFSTEVTEFGSGHEQRNVNWSRSRERWNVAYGMDTEANCQLVIDFFYARRGRAYGFRFKNHSDYQVIGEVIGDGNGSTTGFQLIRSYTSGEETFERTILKPVLGTVTIYVDGVPDGSVVIDYDTGLISFGTPPGSGEEITADFEFDIPVRFDVDYLPENFTTYQVSSIDVPIMELKSA